MKKYLVTYMLDNCFWHEHIVVTAKNMASARKMLKLWWGDRVDIKEIERLDK